MVKLNNFLTLLGLFTLGSFASAYEDECEELSEFLRSNENYTVSVDSCSSDDTGKISSLILDGESITQDVIDIIANYKSINYLEFLRLGEIKNLNLESLEIQELYIYDLRYGRKTNKFNGNTVSAEVIKTLKNIDIVTFAGYQITQETIDAFSTLTNVKKIDFNQCGYDLNLNFSKLKNAKSLTSLSIDTYNYFGNAQYLVEFPESLCQVKQLKELDIMDKFTSLPSCIKKLKNLEKLDLSSNELIEIPNELGSLTKLKDLNLSYNSLTAVPTSLKNLSKLENLDLSKNLITEVSSDICKLESLKILSLYSNEITKISSCIQNLSKLQELVVNSNKLTTIPSGIYKLKSLETLDVSYNAITKVSSNIKNLKNIKYLELSNNEITDIQSAIGKLSKLETLYLNSNKINATIPESLNNLQELQSLNLNYNVDIRGKTLTNPKLDYCHYNIRDNATKDGICESENAVCKSDEDIPKC